MLPHKYMTRSIIIICFSFLLISKIVAENPGPTILKKSKTYQIENRYLIYHDTSGNQNLSQIIDNYNAGKFFTPEDGFIIEPYRTYWLRIELFNDNPGELTWMLHFKAQISHVFLYPFFGSGNKPVATVPDSSISVIYISENRILLPVHYNIRNVYYLKLVNYQGSETRLNHMCLSPHNGYRHYWLTHGLWVGLVIGGVFLMMLYGLISFVITPNKLFLYYFLYTFFVELFIITITFIGEQYIFKNNPWLCFKCCIILLVAFMFYFPFIRKMVINESNTRIDKWLFRPFIVLMLINSTFVSAVVFIKEDLFAKLYDITLFSYSAFSLLMVFLLWRTNKKTGRVILAGMAIMVISGSLTIALYALDAVEENHSFNIGVYIELIFFTYAMILLKKEIEQENNKNEIALIDSRNKIENNQRELTQKALHLAQQEEILENLKNQLLEIKGEKPQTNELVLNILSDVNLYLKQNSWEEFEHYFIEVHPAFYRNLKDDHPELTQMELRVCAMLRLNLNTKQIADITRKTPKSVEITRFRIRQKMGLIRDESLFDKLSSI